MHPALSSCLLFAVVIIRFFILFLKKKNPKNIKKKQQKNLRKYIFDVFVLLLAF
jgi:hypothetical protein